MNSRLDIDEKKIKLFSTIGPRATFGLAMLDVVKLYKNIILLTSDVSTSAGLDRFRNQYKENYIDVGISEQNLINVATGLSKIDFNVITTTFAPPLRNEKAASIAASPNLGVATTQLSGPAVPK